MSSICDPSTSRQVKKVEVKYKKVTVACCACQARKGRCVKGSTDGSGSSAIKARIKDVNGN